MKIAAIQMRSGVDIDANISAADSLIRAAAVYYSVPQSAYLKA